MWCTTLSGTIAVTEYLYRPSLFGSVAQFSITYIVTPKLADYSWEGEPSTTSASDVGLSGIIIPFGCDG